MTGKLNEIEFLIKQNKGLFEEKNLERAKNHEGAKAFSLLHDFSIPTKRNASLEFSYSIPIWSIRFFVEANSIMPIKK